MPEEIDLMKMLGAAKGAKKGMPGMPGAQAPVLPRFIELLTTYQKTMHDIYISEQLLQDPLAACTRCMVVIGAQGDASLISPGGLPSKVSMLSPQDVLEQATQMRAQILEELWAEAQKKENAKFIVDWQDFIKAIPESIRNKE